MDPQSPYLQLTTESVNGHQVIVVTGEVDLCTSPVLHDYLRGAADSPGDLVLDLSALTFMNSSGLTVLIQADQRACRAGGRLRLAALTAPITRLLTLMRLEMHFDLYPTLSAATTAPGAAKPEPAVAHANSSEPPVWPHLGIGEVRNIRSAPAWARQPPAGGPGPLPGGRLRLRRPQRAR